MSLPPAVPGSPNPEDVSNASPVTRSEGENLARLILRRTRYVAAILLSAALFWYLAWSFVAPPPQWGSVSLLAWQSWAGVLGMIVLFVLFLATITLSALLTHPDAPHTGLYCAALGMAALAIRGGPINMLLEYGELHGKISTIHGRLLWEALIWAVLIIIVEFFNRVLFRRLFANRVWLHRVGLLVEDAQTGEIPGLVWGKADDEISGASKEGPHPMLINAAALVTSLILATILLQVFMQSQAKGQVLFACFVSFGLSTLVSHYIFPRSAVWALWLAIPLTAAVGYLRAKTNTPFPNHAATALARALPIDYIVAGLPGAILGYQVSLRSHLHPGEKTEDHAQG